MEEYIKTGSEDGMCIAATSKDRNICDKDCITFCRDLSARKRCPRDNVFSSFDYFSLVSVFIPYSKAQNGKLEKPGSQGKKDCSRKSKLGITSFETERSLGGPAVLGWLGITAELGCHAGTVRPLFTFLSFVWRGDTFSDFGLHTVVYKGEWKLQSSMGGPVVSRQHWRHSSSSCYRVFLMTV